MEGRAFRLQIIFPLIRRVKIFTVFTALSACTQANDDRIFTEFTEQESQSKKTTFSSVKQKSKKDIAPVTEVIHLNDTWRYKKGDSALDTNWNELDFDDSQWLMGKAGFGYGDGDDTTIIHDMVNKFSTIYIRKKFNYSGKYSINTMQMNIYYDDGFIAYINGREVAQANMPSGVVSHLTLAKNSHEANKIETFDLTKYKDLINRKENVFAVEIHNSSISSSDLSLNPNLVFNKTIAPSTVQKNSKFNEKPKIYRSRQKKNSYFCQNKKSCGTLANYKVATAFKKLNYIKDDLSGITFSGDSNSFFVIDNGLGYVLEIDSSFNLIRKIKSRGFGDAEDIVYLGSNNEFAIVNEDSQLFIGTISPTSRFIEAKDFQKITFDSYKGNEGAEGVAFDESTQTFYIVKEEHPRKLYSFTRPTHKNNITVTPSFPFDIQKVPYPRLTQDLSSVVFNPKTKRLLLLSDKDYRVVDIALDGTVYGVLQLPEWKQPEGVTLDNKQNLHIVGEPNNYTKYTNPN